ncbi:MAG: nitroreductase/quinone reductase family protein [Chloroflexota bacterium]
MTKRKYTTLQRFGQKITSTRPGAWFFSKNLHYFDRVVLKLTKNRSTLTGILSGIPVVILTCKGAKSGLARSVPLLGILDETGAGKVALIASNWGQDHHPSWYYNLKANPDAQCSLKGQVQEYKAHEAQGEEYARFWGEATDTYMGFPHYKRWAGDRQIPIMVLAPVGK